MKRGFSHIFLVLSLVISFSFVTPYFFAPEIAYADPVPGAKRTEESRQTISSTPTRDVIMVKYKDGYTLIINDEKGLSTSVNNAQLYPPGTTFTGQGENWASNKPVESWTGGVITNFDMWAQLYVDPKAGTYTGQAGDPNRYEMTSSKTDWQYWVERIFEWILTRWLQIITGVLTVAGEVFDKIVTFALDNSKFMIDGPDGLGGTIELLWRFVRDIANIVIVFSMLYLAIRTIIEGEGFADKKKLASVLLAAILINFSLFFTRLALTISNDVALSIRNQIHFNASTGTPTGANVADTSLGDAQNGRQSTLSEGIVHTLGIPKTINYISNESVKSGSLIDYQGVQFQYLLMLTFSVIGVSVILVGGALILLYRFIAFIFLMIGAPFGLVALFIPWLKQHGDKWFNMVKALTFLAPVYFLSFYVSMMLLSQIVKLGTVAQAGSNANFMAVLVQMAVQTILIVGTLIVTILFPVKVSAAGGQFIGKVGNWAQGRIRNIPKWTGQTAARAALSGSARVQRQVLGRMGSRLLSGNEKTKKDLQEAARGTGMASVIARARLRSSEGLKNRTYDLRNVGGMGKKLGVGEGIDSWQKKVTERNKKAQERLEAKRKAETERYGYDKVKASEQEITRLQEVRNTQSEEVKKAEQKLKDAINANASASVREQLGKDLAEARKQLEKDELEVGRAVNKGIDDQFKKMKARWSNNMTAARRAALKKMEEEMEKKFKADGKAKKKKKGGGNNSGGSGGSGGGTP